MKPTAKRVAAWMARALAPPHPPADGVEAAGDEVDGTAESAARRARRVDAIGRLLAAKPPGAP